MKVDSEKVVKLALSRVVPRDIAAQFNVPVETIYGVLKKARSDGANIPSFLNCASVSGSVPAEKVVGVDLAVKADVTVHSMVIPNRLHSLLVREAERRGKTPAETAQRLLEDGLLSGVRS